MLADIIVPYLHHCNLDLNQFINILSIYHLISGFPESSLQPFITKNLTLLFAAPETVNYSSERKGCNSTSLRVPQRSDQTALNVFVIFQGSSVTVASGSIVSSVTLT